MGEDKGKTGLADVVERLQEGALTLDEALSAVAAKSLLRHAGVHYIAHANYQSYASLNAGKSDLALVWARAAQEALDYLRPPPRNLGLRLSRRITSAVGLHDGVLAYSEYLAGIAVLHLGRYQEAKASMQRAQAIAERTESAGFTAADCAQIIGQIPM